MSDQGTLPISAFIIAQDEEDRIGRAIESVRPWAAEVVVVDSGSSDNTREVALALGARVVDNAWPGYGPQKRFAEDLCANDWLFNLDADEEATEALQREIRELFRRGVPASDGFRVWIAAVYPHEARPRKWGFGHSQIRLYDRRKGRFSDSPVHDVVELPPHARVAWLRSPMVHCSHRSIAFSLEKMNRYSDAQVADMRARGRRIGKWRLVFEFPVCFLKAYVLRRSFLHGWWGWVIAINYAFSRHLRLAKAYEAELLQAAGRRDGARGRAAPRPGTPAAPAENSGARQP